MAEQLQPSKVPFYGAGDDRCQFHYGDAAADKIRNSKTALLKTSFKISGLAFRGRVIPWGCSNKTD